MPVDGNTSSGDCPLPSTNLALLHIAAHADSLECFDLLQRRGIPLTSQSADEYFPIHYACRNGSLEVLAYLLEQPSPPIDRPELILFGAQARHSRVLEMLFHSNAPRFANIVKGIFTGSSQRFFLNVNTRFD
jgi:ankyrin repeat protein